MVSQALLARGMRYKEMAALTSADSITVAVASVVFAWLGFGYWSLVLAAVCGSGIKWAGGVMLVGWQMSFRFVPSAANELLSFAFGTYARGLLEYVSLTIDNLIVGRVLGVTALGYYDKAFASTQRAYNKLTVGGPRVSFRALAVIQDDPPALPTCVRKDRRQRDRSDLRRLRRHSARRDRTSSSSCSARSGGRRSCRFSCSASAGRCDVSNAFAGAAANARGWIWLNVWRQAVYVA